MYLVGRQALLEVVGAGVHLVGLLLGDAAHAWEMTSSCVLGEKGMQERIFMIPKYLQ